MNVEFQCRSNHKDSLTVEDATGGLWFEIRAGDSGESLLAKLSTDDIRELRDALTEWLGDGPSDVDAEADGGPDGPGDLTVADILGEEEFQRYAALSAAASILGYSIFGTPPSSDSLVAVASYINDGEL